MKHIGLMGLFIVLIEVRKGYILMLGRLFYAFTGLHSFLIGLFS
jgi:hypothetical protein